MKSYKRDGWWPRCVSLFAVSLLPLGAQAAITNSFWSGTNAASTWSLLDNWAVNFDGTGGNPAYAVGASNIAYFGISTSNSTPQTATLGAALNINGFVFSNTAATAINTDGVANRAITLGSGGITIASGAGAVTFGTTVNLNRDTFTLAAAQTWKNDSANTFSLNANNTIALGANKLTFDGTGNTTAAGIISGTGGLIKNGSGMLTLSAVNTFTTGGITLNTGTLKLGANAALGGATSVFVINGGVIDATAARTNVNNNAMVWSNDFAYAGSFTWDTGTGAVTLGGNRTVTVSNSTMTVGGVIDDGVNTYSLTKMGAGILTLTNANTYGGNTLIGQGVLSVAGTGSLPDWNTAGRFAVSNDATLAVGNAVIDGNIDTLQGTGNFLAGASLGFDTSAGDRTSAAVISNSVNGALGLVKIGANTLTLSGVNTYTGGTKINAGTLLAEGTAWASTGLLTLGGGTFSNMSDRALANDVNLSAASTVGVLGTKTLTLSGVITNTGGLTKQGAGELILSGNNTYTGLTTIQAGTLTLSGNRTAASGGITLNNGTVNIQNGAFSLGANTFFVGSGAVGDATVNQSAGDIAFSAGNALLIGNSGRSGLTSTYNLSGGSITAVSANGVRLGVNAATAGNPQTAIFNLSGAGVLNTTGSLQIGRSDGAAHWVNATFDQTGGTATIGTLTLGGMATTANSATNVNAVLNLTGGTFTATNFTLLSAGTNNTAAITIGGTANVTLPAFPTARGLNSTATLTFDGGSLSNTAASTKYMQGLDHVYITTNGATFNVGAAITVSQIMENASALNIGNLTKAGGGALTLAAANTYSGGTVLSLGTLNIGNAAALGTGALTINGGTLDNSSGAILTNANNNAMTWADDFAITGTKNMHLGNGAVTLTAARTITVNANTQTVDGTISGTGLNALDITKNGSGTLVLNANVAMTGNQTNTVNTGLLNIDGAISGAGNSLTKLGAGTLQLSGNNTFSGGLIIKAGTVVGTPYTGTTMHGLGGNGTGAVTLGDTSGNADASLLFDNCFIYNPITVVDGSTGTLTLGGRNGAPQMQGTATLTLNNLTTALNITGNLAIHPVISGHGSIVSAGTFTPDGANTFDGGLTLKSGILNINRTNALGAASGLFTIDGGTINSQTNLLAATTAVVVKNPLMIDGNFTFTGTKALTFNTGAATLGTNAGTTRTISPAASAAILTINNNIADGTTAKSITFAGSSAAVILGGNSTFSGGVFMGGAVDLRVTHNNALGTGPITLTANGAGFSGSGTDVVLTNSFHMNQPGESAWNALSSSITFSGPVDGTGSVGFNGFQNGTIGFSGDNSGWSGTIRSTGQAQLRLGHTNALGSGLLIIGTSVGSRMLTSLSSSADLSAGNGVANNISNNTATTLYLDNNLKLSGQITGGGGLRMGPGSTATLNLTGANDYTGFNNIQAGTVSVSAIGNGGSTGPLGAGLNTAIYLNIGGGASGSSGTLLYTGAGETSDRLFTIGSASTAFGTSGIPTVTLGNTVIGRLDASGSGALILNNTGALGVGNATNTVLELTGSNTGTNTLAAVIGNSTDGNVKTTGADSTLSASGTGGANRQIILADTTGVQVGDVVSSPGNIPDGAVVTAVLSPTLLAISAGATNDSTTAVITFTPNSIAGNKTSLLKSGAGTWKLTGANTYTGGTTINDGRLQLGVDNALLNTGAVQVNGSGAIYDLGGFNTVTNGAVTMGSNGGLITNGMLVGLSYGLTNGTVAAVLAGPGALTKGGAGTTVTLSGQSTYAGATTNLGGGTLALGVNNALPTNTTLYADSGSTLDLAGNNQQVAGLDGYSGTINNSGAASTLAVKFGSGTPQNFLGSVTGASTLTLTGGGTLKVNNGGTSFGVGTATVVSNGSTLFMNSTHLGVITAYANSTVGGSGAISTLIVTNGGFFAPGATLGLGTQTVHSLTLAPGGLLAVGLANASNGLARVDTSFAMTNALLRLDLTNYTFTSSDITYVVLDYTGTAYTPNADNQLFTLQDWGMGAVANQLLTNNMTFAVAGGLNSATNFFRINYDVLANGQGVGSNITLTSIPEPGTATLFGLVGVLWLVRRKLHGQRRRWNV